jgi:hemin uptake protein HemP
MTPKRAAGRPSAPPSGAPSNGTPKQVSSEQLLGPAGELVIVHAGRQYRLRVTQNGKLILTA